MITDSENTLANKLVADKSRDPRVESKQHSVEQGGIEKRNRCRDQQQQNHIQHTITAASVALGSTDGSRIRGVVAHPC